MESQIGALILATDISRQNEYLSLFRSHLDKGDLCLEDENHRHLILQVIYRIGKTKKWSIKHFISLLCVV